MKLWIASGLVVAVGLTALFTAAVVLGVWLVSVGVFLFLAFVFFTTLVHDMLRGEGEK